VVNIVIYAIGILNGLYDEIFLTVLMLTLALASLAASASAAMALCSCTGSRTSFLSTKYYMHKDNLEAQSIGTTLVHLIDPFHLHKTAKIKTNCSSFS
jgi:hypothetical protein